MATLDANAIAVLAYRAGWRGKDLAVSVAVALAESSGNPSAKNSSAAGGQWGPAVGLWQVRCLVADKGKGTQRDELANLNPETNAKNAYAIWQSQGWGGWSAHSNKSYLLYLTRATTAAAAVTASGPAVNAGVEAASSVQSAISDAADQVKSAVSDALTIAEEPIKVLKWLQDPGNMWRIGKFVAGGALLVAAFYVIAQPVVAPVVNKVVPVAAGVAKKAVTKGAA